MQVEPIKPTLKPNGTKRLKLQCDILPSTSVFNFNLRRYTKAMQFDFGVAAKFGGNTYLRFDDTNPAAEKQAGRRRSHFHLKP